ncbi:RNA polymerase sigma factor [Chondromyces apiculatus]|uniref:RNA polymerase sigma factor RpoE n=1 Tax=Chondromyces apiculatus DSM 436 TaxID=1192034 RepID=A0A017TBR5_9BACT|nr:RNA polymerase sigma factor [Chondromyces apiculatus]EYF06265.1 RNA polymerase sigma factor RpoE [Chondromyces apiculatus DSM 436]
MASEKAGMAAGLALVGSEDEEGRSIEALIGAGDYRQALTHCARAHAMALGKLCMAFTGSQAEAEEMVQETLLAAYDAFPQYRAEGSVRAWLFGIARRLCGRHAEMKTRRESRLRLVHDTRPRPDAGELALEKERAERARAALAKLKPSEREAVVLRFEGGLSFKELSIACGVDEAAARKRVSRALAKLRAELGEE